MVHSWKIRNPIGLTTYYCVSDIHWANIQWYPILSCHGHCIIHTYKGTLKYTFYMGVILHLATIANPRLYFITYSLYSNTILIHLFIIHNVLHNHSQCILGSNQHWQLLYFANLKASFSHSDVAGSNHLQQKTFFGCYVQSPR